MRYLKYTIAVVIIICSVVLLEHKVKADYTGSTLIGWFRFDNNQISGSTLIDLGTGAHNLTTTNSPTTGLGAPNGQAIKFNGVDQYAINTSGVIQSTPFTLCYWAIGYTNGGVAWSALSKDSDTWNGWYGAPGTLAAPVNNDFSGAAIHTGTNSAVWMFECDVAASATSRTIYINGVPGTTDTTNKTQTASANNYQFTIGNNKDGSILGNYANGTYDDFRIYSAALTRNQIIQLYLSTRMWYQ